LEYMVRLQASDQSGIPTSFEAAQVYAPGLAKASDWEEDYHFDGLSVQ
jgi:hypothetical protein